MSLAAANATAAAGVAGDAAPWPLHWYPAASSAIYSVAFVLGSVINGLALWVFTHTSKKNKVHVFMINLSAANLVAVALMPLRLFHSITRGWPLGEPCCRALVAARCVHSAAILWFFACVSVEHYLAVVHKAAAAPIRRAKVYRVASAAVWLLVATQVPPIFVTDEGLAGGVNGRGSCHKMSVITSWREIWLQQVVTSAVHFLLPFGIITVVYFQIVRFLLDKAAACRVNHGGTGAGAGNLGSSKVSSKPLKIFFTIVALLVVFFMPYHVAVAVLLGTRSLTSAGEKGGDTGSGAIACLSLLMDFSCCMMFPLYFIVSKYFRQRFNSVLVYRRYLTRLSRKRRSSVAMDTLE